MRFQAPTNPGRGFGVVDVGSVQSLWNRFLVFALVNDMTPNCHSSALFIDSVSVSVKAKHTYAQKLIYFFRKINEPHQNLKTPLDSAFQEQGTKILL